MQRISRLPIDAQFLLFAFVALWSGAQASCDGADTIQVEGGKIGGATSADGVRSYKGIPFAAPPVGQRRWQPPQPVVPWAGVRDCQQFGPVCPQLAYPAGSIYAQAPQKQSEDCLFLNVWTAAKSAEETRPVMVWIHGGALTRGSGSIPPYDGTSLARGGAVVVTCNYRLGPLGFLAHPALSKESDHGSSGNYGMLDQIESLRWVQKNIAHFGGDPTRVTIFGESAGSWSVCYLVASPLAKGLFHRAIGQSGGAFGLMPFLKEDRHGTPSAEKTGERVAAALGCDKADDPAAAMRAKTAEELLSAAESTGARLRPNVDGWLLPDDVHGIFTAGRQNDVPVIVGSTADEGTTLFAALVPKTKDAYVAGARAKYGDLADEFLKVYPANEDADVRAAFLASMRDEWFTWEMRTWARLTERAGGKAYQYFFSHVPPSPNHAQIGAYHAAEILYVFNNLPKVDWPFSDADRKLAENVSSAWIRFADTGNPNGGGLPQWTSYDASSQYYLEFGDTIEPHRELLKAQCDFFDRYYAAKRAEP
ncbi:MAG: carboxylesterase family protein [Planctomycetia bacterium]|nr:carboxylesterase family protein [Planctomycetia bacterium]